MAKNTTEWFTPKAEKYLRDNYATKSDGQIAKVLGVVPSTIWRYAHKLGLKHEYKLHSKIGWTEEMNDYLRKHYPTTKNKEIAKVLGVSATSLIVHAHKLGLRKTKEFMQEMQANATREALVMTKGVKKPGYRIPNSEKYQFKPGHQRWGKYSQEERAEIMERIRKTREATVAAERRRMLYGLPPKTNLKLSFLSRKEQKRQITIRYRLKVLGYTVTRGSKTVMYDANTQRTKRERDYERLGFNFREI